MAIVPPVIVPEVVVKVKPVYEVVSVHNAPMKPDHSQPKFPDIVVLVAVNGAFMVRSQDVEPVPLVIAMGVNDAALLLIVSVVGDTAVYRS